MFSGSAVTSVPIVAGLRDVWAAGILNLSGNRVLDVLNDASSGYLKLNEVNVSLDRIDKAASPLPQAIIVKSQMLWVAILSDKHESPEKRFHSFVARQSESITVVVPGSVIRGTTQVTAAKDPVLFMSRGGAGFFPVTNARLESSSHKPLEAPVIFVNYKAVQILHLTTDPH